MQFDSRKSKYFKLRSFINLRAFVIKMASGAKFLDEVCEQFLTCRVCSKTFRNPKALSCLHTFCCECLENCYETEEQQKRPYRFLLYARVVSCPVCNVKTDIPTGGISRLPDNIFLEELCQMVSRSSASNVENKTCEICRNCQMNASDNVQTKLAVTKCMDCSKFLCQECSDRHKSTKVTCLHSLFKLDIEKDLHCKVHLSEMIKYFCETCDECICLLCAFQYHKNHEVCLITEIVDKGKISLKNILKECETMISNMNDSIRSINDFEVYVKEIEDQIREYATEMISLIRQKERDLIAQIKPPGNSKETDNTAFKEILESSVRKLEASATHANAIMKENSIEVMLAKTLVKEQMSSISTHTNLLIPSLPTEECRERSHFFKLRERLKEDENHFEFVSLDQFTQTEIQFDDHLHNSFLSEVTDGEKNKCRQWQKCLPLIEVVQNTVITPVVFLKVAPIAMVKSKDSFTEMPRVAMLDKSVTTHRVHFSDKETSTFHAKVMHKNISTVSQVTVDKSTSTSNDVSVIQRTVANIKRQITVSRGTMTTFPRAELTTFNLQTCTRSTSPIK